MTMLKSSNVHESCCARGIRQYLEDHYGRDDESRALAWDYLNVLPEEAAAWDRAMDEMRARHGHDVAQKDRKCIHYYHFVISPDPRDDIDLNKLRLLATEWAGRVFGRNGDDGILGNAMCAICYHDDNANHVPHAHVIVNCTNMSTGRKLHVSKKDNEERLPDLVQEISEELGLSVFDNKALRESRTARRNRDLAGLGIKLTPTERALDREMRWSWKQEVREQVNVAKLCTYSEAQFRRQLADNGIEVRASKEAEGEWVYALASNPKRMSVRADRLGTGYSREQVGDFRARLINRFGPPAPGTELALDAARETVRRNVSTWISGIRVVAEHDGPVDLSQVARVLDTSARHRILSDEGYAAAILDAEDALEAARAQGDGQRGDALEREIALLREAQGLAAEVRLFHGAAFPSPPPPRRGRAARPGGAGKRGQAGGSAGRRRARATQAPAPRRGNTI